MSGPGRRLCWIVEQDGAVLGDVLARLAPLSRGALEEGRVFVAGRRTDDAGAVLRAGAPVEVTASREQADDEVALLASQDGLVAAYKPAALPTEPDRAGRHSARREVSRRLDIQEGRLHALSRLDVGVSGVVLFATTSEARRRVQAARDAGQLKRRYVGIAAGEPAPAAGQWSAPIDGRAATTRYAAVATAGAIAPGAARATLLALEPVSGRTHQLRIHAARAGAPLVGDRAHGGSPRLCAADGSVTEVRRVALHAAWVELRDRPAGWRVETALPDDLRVIWRSLGGSADSWARALAGAGLGDGVE